MESNKFYGSIEWRRLWISVWNYICREICKQKAHDEWGRDLDNATATFAIKWYFVWHDICFNYFREKLLQNFSLCDSIEKELGIYVGD